MHLTELNLNLLKRYAWLEPNGLIADVLIQGNTNTRINLAWFTKDGFLTNKGTLAYNNLIKNNISI